MKIAILGWGSLLWEKNFKQKKFNEQLVLNKQLGSYWHNGGPTLPLEFSRISESRNGALTLVIDAQNGNECPVTYAFSKRENPDKAIDDLMKREGTKNKENIGRCHFADKSQNYSRNDSSNISKWAKDNDIEVVIWTDLESNFKDKTGKLFSIENALSYIKKLNAEDNAKKAIEYVRNAPEFIVTPLRKELQLLPCFQ